MKTGAGRRLTDWARMILPALALVALKALFRGAAAASAGHAGSDSSIALAADALSLTVTLCFALAVCSREIAKPGLSCGTRQLARCAAVGVAAGLAALWIGRLSGIGDDRPGGVLAFVVLCLLGPIAEELVYRGLVFGRGKRFLPAGWTIAVSALLFAASHGSPPRMALAAAAGVLLGCARQREETILAPILIHSVMNSVQFIAQHALAR